MLAVTAPSPRPRTLATICAIALATGAVTAQRALFIRAGGLVADDATHAGARAAVQRLLRGPDAGQRARGWTTHVPRATRLVDCRITTDPNGTGRATLVFTSELLTATAREDALEQIQKTALSDPAIQHVELRLQNADGTESDLGTLLGHPPARQRPGRQRTARQRTALDQGPNVPQNGQGSTAAASVASGILNGRRIAISPGHGYYWHSTLGWTTQRPLIDGLLEDIHVAEICNRYLIPMLRNMGAEVILCRETGELTVDAVADNDGGAPGYTENGAWSLSGSSGYLGGTYRFAGTSPTETATATWTIPVTTSGVYPIYAWFRASGNRTPTALYRVTHAAGTDEVVIDQTVDNLTWVHLGNWWFDAGSDAMVTLSNQSFLSGVVIADAMRLGGGVGTIARGGSTSGRPRWQECARYWTQFAGAPSSVYNTAGQDNADDVTTRPRFAEWRGADAFVSLHTNAGGGAGTSSFIYSGGATPGSSTLQSRIHTQIISDLRSEWSATWTDRGQQSANFGEVRLLSTMPGVLLELAFHDTAGSFDHRSLHDPDFRYLGARAIARGIMRYFAPTAPFVPEPPRALRVTQDGSRGLLVAWDQAASATGYIIEWSPDGKSFVEAGTSVSTSWSTGPLPYDTVRSFRVRATNGSGQSIPTEVLTAGTDHTGTAQALLVQGFDRVGRYVKAPENTRDYLRLIGGSIRSGAFTSLGFDAASNEAVALGRVPLAYGAVVWSLGEESTADETFSAAEQSIVQSYLAQGGGLLVTGAEVGWDLDSQGSASDRAFYRNQIGATYIADDANTYGLQGGIAGTVSAGIPPSAFDNGTGGTYDVDYPDVIGPTPGTGGNVCLRYFNGQAAGIQRVDPVTGARVVHFGFPLDTMQNAAARDRLVQQSLAFLLEPRELTSSGENAPLGQRLDLDLTIPGENGQLYLLLASEGNDVGIPLIGGNLLPLRPGFLIGASLNPASPVFGNFLGNLDPNGQASAFVDVPNLAFLTGLEVWFAAFTADPVSLVDREVTNWVRVVLGP